MIQFSLYVAFLYLCFTYWTLRARFPGFFEILLFLRPLNGKYGTVARMFSSTKTPEVEAHSHVREQVLNNLIPRARARGKLRPAEATRLAFLLLLTKWNAPFGNDDSPQGQSVYSE